MTATMRRRLTRTMAVLGVTLAVVAPTTAARASAPVRPADDVYCRYFTTQDGWLLNWDYSLEQYLYYGTIVVHVRGTVDGSGNRGVRVENSGQGGWWRYGLKQVGSCWT